VDRPKRDLTQSHCWGQSEVVIDDFTDSYIVRGAGGGRHEMSEPNCYRSALGGIVHGDLCRAGGDATGSRNDSGAE
jgi:hypothetical protein